MADSVDGNEASDTDSSIARLSSRASLHVICPDVIDKVIR